MALETIEPGEFEQWVTVRRAVEQVSAYAPDGVMGLLVGRIRSASIPIAVREYVRFNVQGEGSASYWVVLRGPKWIENVGPTFWEAGDHTIRVSRDSTGYSGTRSSAEIHGTRLNPEAIDALLRELEASAPSPSPVPGRSPHFGLGDKRRWISAKAALTALVSVPHAEAEAKQTIIDRAAANMIASRCDRQTIEFPDQIEEPDSTDSAPIDSHFWRHFKRARESELWNSGDFATRYWDNEIGEELDLPATYLRVFGVEFCEEDLCKIPGVSAAVAKLRSTVLVIPGAHDFSGRPSEPKILSQIRQQFDTDPVIAHGRATALRPDDDLNGAAPQAKRKPVKRGTPVNDVEFRDWYGSLSSADQALGYRELTKRANISFRPRKVVRKLAEELVKGLERKPGRKPDAR